jgi:hypothetical protein
MDANPSGGCVIVWTSQDSHGTRRYIRSSQGQFVSYGRYVHQLVEAEEERAQKRREYQDNARMRRWARAYKAHKANGNGHSGECSDA